MCEENPGEIDFGSNQHKAWFNKGLSYQESTVYLPQELKTCTHVK